MNPQELTPIMLDRRRFLQTALLASVSAPARATPSAPAPGVGSLQCEFLSYRSMTGVVASELTRKQESFDLTVRVPANATATVILTGGREEQVGAGEHRFKVRV